MMMDTGDEKRFSGQQRQNRRGYPRVKVRVPVELRPEGSEVPIHATTSDISLGGCYVELIFTLAKDTQLEINLGIDGTVLALGTVVTCDPQVGNGIKFTRMLPEDIEELGRYLEAAQSAVGSLVES